MNPAEGEATVLLFLRDAADLESRQGLAGCLQLGHSQSTMALHHLQQPLLYIWETQRARSLYLGICCNSVPLSHL